MSLIYKYIVILLSLVSFTVFATNNIQLQTENEIRESLKKTTSHDLLLSLNDAQIFMNDLLVKVSGITDKALALEVYYANLVFLTTSDAPVDDFHKALNDVLHLAKEIKNHETYGLALTLKGAFYSRKDNIPEEIAAYKNALKYAKKHNLKQVFSGNLNNLGNRYQSLGLLDQALKYFQEAIEIDSYPLIVNNLATINILLGNLDTAEHILNSEDELGKSGLLLLFDVSVAQKNTEKAKALLEKIKRDFQPLSSVYIAYTTLAEAELYYSLKEYGKAADLFEKGLNSNVYLEKEYKHEALLLLSKSYFQLGNYKLAASSYEKWALYSDEANKKRTMQATSVILAEFNLELEVNKKEIAEKNLLIANDKLASHQRIKTLETFITVLSLGLAILIAFMFYKQHRKNRMLNEFAHTDTLTKVNNRRSLLSHLERRICNIKEGELLSIAMLDIDHFKRVNDTYGHDIGDKVLCEFSSFVAGFLRKSDIFGRFGGEEFLIIFNDNNVEQAKNIIERLLVQLADVPFSEVGKVTCSVGLAQYLNHDIKALIVEADEKLYIAKNAGRNQVAA
ncbi:hypothetical protein A3Q34_12820 [Colwellia sp. PAMC 20917]|uniref:tetratricopeptide repeat-containing diguanylate cyclase n=1 Tax=Colwellia sp. PAMC 20917 TaxID=1816218 RepID=UPI000878501B|nr:GGDEF domain-containing protein [Colwellia sp. PAMC 20917]AOW77656.1 hypothetical protein A3Q34_12820 [Colwellia sp. PAMC 20917]